MSAYATAWAWTQPAKGSDKLVLLALADESNDAGECASGMAKIAERCGVTRQTVSRAIESLQGAGLLVREHLSGGRDRKNDRITLQIANVRFANVGGSNVGTPSPSPSPPPSPSPDPSPSRPHTLAPTHAPGSALAHTDAHVREAAPPAWSYRRKQVPVESRRMALEVLAAYNERAGQEVKPFGSAGVSESLSLITGAVLDHPATPLERWASLVDYVLANPWWEDGVATVNVVFSPKMLETNIARWKQRDAPRPQAVAAAARPMSAQAAKDARIMKRRIEAGLVLVPDAQAG